MSFGGGGFYGPDLYQNETLTDIEAAILWAVYPFPDRGRPISYFEKVVGASSTTVYDLVRRRYLIYKRDDECKWDSNYSGYALTQKGREKVEEICRAGRESTTTNSQT